MRNLVIAYHTYLYGSNHIQMMTEQFRKLVTTGLFEVCSKLYIGVTISENRKPENGVEWLQYFWKDTDKVEIVVYPENNEETDTLKWVKNYSIENPDDYILYFHTKGISKQNNATEDWRRYMEYFVVENWKDCIVKLDEGYDCCGVMWNSKTPQGIHPHFSGTFWWATAKYINTLQDNFLNDSNRYFREYWIGSNQNVKQYEFHNSGLNSFESLKKTGGHYTLRYPRNNYVKKGNRILQVICTAYERPTALRVLIESFLLQTNPNWVLYIIYDGTPPKEIFDVISSYEDKRIIFEHTPKRNGNYGHPNRDIMLQQIGGSNTDFVLITNDDNYYVPKFIEYMFNMIDNNTGIVYCDTVHSLLNYTLHKSVLRERGIDMGAFIVRFDIAKLVGFKSIHESADGAYAAECKRYCDNRGMLSKYIPKPLFVHN